MKSSAVKLILGVDPLLSPLTGIGQYTRALGQSLKLHPDVACMKLFALGKFFKEDLLYEQDKLQANKLSSGLTVMGSIRRSLAASTPAVWLYERTMPVIEKSRLAAYSDYLYHSPNFFVPRFDGPKVVTFHDLSTVLYPTFHPKVRVELAQRQMDIAVASNAHIICGSDVIAQEVQSHYGVSSKRISRVYLAAGDEFRPRQALECLPVLNQFDVEFGQFFLFVSTIEPRKNLLALLDAFYNYCQKNSSPLPLVIVGNEGWNSTREHNKIKELQRKGLIRYCGYLPQHALPLLYAGARALLYPSIYEGFGLPVLEAMQSGVVVMTSQNTSMDEIAGGAALLVNPADIDQMSESIACLASDDALVDTLRNRGLINARAFSWQSCANQTVAIYQQVLARQ